MNKTWIDASVPLHTGMVHWPTDPSVRIERFADMEKGAICNVSKVDMCAHAGTHMDGLNHFIRNGAPLDTVPFDAVIGPCRVIEIKDDDSAQTSRRRTDSVENPQLEAAMVGGGFRHEVHPHFEGSRTAHGRLRDPDDRRRLPLGGRLSARRRRVPSSAARRGRVDHRRIEPDESETGQIRSHLFAGENPEQRRRPGAGGLARKIEPASRRPVHRQPTAKILLQL